MLIFKNKHKWLVILTVFLMAIHSLNNVFLAIIINQMIEAAVNSSMESFIFTAGIGIMGFVVFMGIGILMTKCKTTVIEKINLSIKNTMIEEIIYHWQNGKVERSHREDQVRFYDKREFKSVVDMLKQHKRYMSRHNNIARKVLDFHSPNQIVENYFEEKRKEAA